MTIATDLVTAKAQIVAAAGIIDQIVNGPASGTGSIVDVNGVSVKTVARIAAEMAGLTLDVINPPAANVSMNSKRLTSLADPSAAQDAATKAYVDAVIQGLTPKPTARLATAAALPACTYANGSSGSGATLTGNANGALSIDSVAVAVDDVVLVKDQAAPAQNGLYSVTQAGDGSHPFILTRHIDMNAAAETAGAFVPVGSAGTANGKTIWLCNPSGAVTMGTTSLPFTQLTAPATQRLDQVPAPTADVSMAGYKLTNLGAPVSSGDAATKGYVDGLSSTPNYNLASGFRNVLRNSGMSQWPMGGVAAAISIAAGASGSASIGPSGWQIVCTGAAVTASRVAARQAPAGYAARLVGNTSVTGMLIQQRVESHDAGKLAGQRCNFQAYLFNSTGSSITPTLSVWYANAADDWSGSTNVVNAVALQAVTASSGATVAYTFDMPANAVNGVQVRIDFGNNFSTSGKYVEICATDLRAVGTSVSTGLNASPPAPEVPNIVSEAQWCGRYHQASYANGTAPATATKADIQGGAPAGGSYGGALTVQYKLGPLRVAPTISYWDGAGNASKYSSSNGGTPLSWTDNISPGSSPPQNISSNGFYLNGNGIYGSGGSLFVHFVAYADFW